MKVLSTTIGLFLSVNANGVFGSDSSNIHGSAGLNTEQETQQFSVKFMKAMKNMKLEDVAISEKVGAGGGMTSKSQNHEKGVSKSLDNEGLGDMMKAGKNNGGLEKPLDDAVEKADDQNNSPGVTKEVFTGRVEQKGLASTSSFTLDEGMSRLKRLNGGGLRGSKDVDSAAVITEVKDILEFHMDSLQSIQGGCNEPIAIGEIRNWADKSQCIDPSGEDGTGGVGTYLCDGLMDQTFKFCEDGTIRSSKSGFCLDVNGNDGLGNVEMWSCVVFPTAAQDQQWDLVPIGGTYVESGIHQKLFHLKNRKSGKCLDIHGNDSVGNVLVYDCDGGVDQKLYIRSRGDVIGHGKLQNEKSGHCLDVNGNDGRGNIGTWTCVEDLQHEFTLYENGELVNAKSKQCMDIGGHDGHGNVEMYPCVALPDQQWTQELWRGEYFSFVSKKSGMCLDVSGNDGKGDASTWQCDDLPDQKWRFIAKGWKTPEGSWKNKFCNESGGISHTITASKSSSDTLTSTTTVEIGLEIEANVIFKKAKVTTKVSQSIAKSWTASTSKGFSVLSKCDYYEDGEAFTGGCLWQWHLTTSSSVNKVSWDAQIIRCTRPNAEPKCPPFSTCADADCSLCE